MITMRENVFVGFCVFSVFMISELRAQQNGNGNENGNVTSAVDAAMTSQRDYANSNETATTVDGDAISGHNGTGSMYIQPGNVQNDGQVTDEEFRHRNVKSNSTLTQKTQISDSEDSRRNNDSAIDVFPFRNSSEETANSHQNLVQAEDGIIERNHPNQTEKHQSTTSEALLLNTLTFSTQGHSFSSTLPPGKQESLETVAYLSSSRAEKTESKSAPGVMTGVTDEKRVTLAVLQTQSDEYPIPVPTVPRTAKTKYATTTRLVRSVVPSRDAGHVAGHVTARSEADDSRTRDVTVVTKAAEFIYKNLWEEVDVKYEAEEEEDDDDDEAKRGSIGAGKGGYERTGTGTEGWKRKGAGVGVGGGGSSTVDARGQLLAVEMEKAKREENAEHLRATRHSFQWQDQMGVLVPVLCGMFGAMSLVLAGYFLRNCPRNIRLLLFKTKDSKLKRRKSDLSLLIDNSSGDERP